MEEFEDLVFCCDRPEFKVVVLRYGDRSMSWAALDLTRDALSFAMRLRPH